MTASDTLRRHLEDAGLEYGKLGDYTTRVTHRGMSFTMEDCYDGVLDVVVSRLTSDEAVSLITGQCRGVPKRYVYYGDGVGHSECTACGGIVISGYGYCPWCGIRLEGVERDLR